MRAAVLLCGLLAIAACRENQPGEEEPTAPIQLPMLDISAWPVVAPEKPTNTDEEQPVVCLIADGRVPFHRAQMQFLRHLDAGDAKYSISIQDARGDAALQASQLAALQEKPPKAILIQPLDLKTVLPVLSELRKRGVVTISLDSLERAPASSSAVLVDLFCDPQEIGRQAAALTVSALQKRALDHGETPASGRILQIRGNAPSSWCEQVSLGFLKGLSGHPNILLVHDAPAQWDPESAKTRFAEALRLQKKIDVVFAHDDFLAQAVHQAARQSESRDDMLIIGVNGFPGTEGGLRMLHRQEIDATVRRPWQVDAAWQVLHDLADNPGLTPKAHQSQPPQLIRPSDLEAISSSEIEE